MSAYARSTSARPATASSRSRWLASGSCRPVSSPLTTRAGSPGPSTSDVHPSYAATRPSGRGGGLQSADHRGADGHHPAAVGRVSSTSRAVVAGTDSHSGCGGSCDSWLATPVCSTSGATTTPLAISSTSTSRDSGRPALGISALPGTAAYTFCRSSIGQAPCTYG